MSSAVFWKSPPWRHLIAVLQVNSSKRLVHWRQNSCAAIPVPQQVPVPLGGSVSPFNTRLLVPSVHISIGSSVYAQLAAGRPTSVPKKLPIIINYYQFFCKHRNFLVTQCKTGQRKPPCQQPADPFTRFDRTLTCDKLMNRHRAIAIILR